MEFITISCAREGCHTIFQLPSEVISRLRESHEDFTCPFGHNQNYPQKTDAEKQYESKLREMEKRNNDQLKVISDFQKKLKAAKSKK